MWPLMILRADHGSPPISSLHHSSNREISYHPSFYMPMYPSPQGSHEFTRNPLKHPPNRCLLMQCHERDANIARMRQARIEGDLPQKSNAEITCQPSPLTGPE